MVHIVVGRKIMTINSHTYYISERKPRNGVSLRFTYTRPMED